MNGPDQLPFAIQENDARYRHALASKHLLPELISMWPTNDYTDERFGGLQYAWIIQNVGERTALKAGRRSSGVGTGKADEHQLAFLLCCGDGLL